MSTVTLSVTAPHWKEHKCPTTDAGNSPLLPAQIHLKGSPDGPNHRDRKQWVPVAGGRGNHFSAKRHEETSWGDAKLFILMMIMLLYNCPNLLKKY